MRLRSFPVWEIAVFLLNGIIFILIGLQLPEVMESLAYRPRIQLIADAVLVSAVVIIVRIVWVFPATYLPRWLSRKVRARDPMPDWRHVAMVAWTGMRGVVSLAAAMALPLTVSSGAPFPYRDLILFLTFSVIVATLVFQGLTLPWVIRWLKIRDDRVAEKEEHDARLRANQAALARLNELAHGVEPDLLARLRGEYEDRIRQLEAAAPEGENIAPSLYTTPYQSLLQELLQVERRAVIQLRNERFINDAVLRRIQRDLDLAEGRLLRETP